MGGGGLEVTLSYFVRNLSGGSADTGIFGSMEKDKRRKKLDSGRVDAEDVINELMEDMHLHDSGSAQEGMENRVKYLVKTSFMDKFFQLRNNFNKKVAELKGKSLKI